MRRSFTDWDNILSKYMLQSVMSRASNAGQLAKSRKLPTKSIPVSSNLLK
uniref:Uncharacterized protein n=1 Tax=Arundo donax TaxID=35708 RepID=A0A0A9QY22_ARUDO